MPTSAPSCVRRRVLVVYSSQTGQAKAIAEDLAEQAPAHGFQAEIHCISGTDKTFWLEREEHAVIITSTTGDGDAPDTAQKFWRRLKKKTLKSDHLSGLRFALLGLGDTNYSNFSNCGKMFRKRLMELGATPFTEEAWADDGTGLEVVVEPWLDNLWPALAKEFSGNKEQPTPATASNPSLDISQTNTSTSNSSQDIRETNTTTTTTNADAHSETALEHQTLIKDSSVQSEESLGNGTGLNIVQKESSNGVNSAEAETSTSTSSAVKGNAEVGGGSKSDSNSGQSSDLKEDSPVESLTLSVPPLSESGLTLPALPASFLQISFDEDLALDSSQAPELQNGCPFPSANSAVITAAITTAKQLTTDDASKKTLLLSLDIKDQDWSYCAGDSIGVLAPNPVVEVDQLLNRLGVGGQGRTPYRLEVIAGTKKRNAAVPAHIPPTGTLFNTLSHSCDIRAPPKKALLRGLVEYTINEGEKRRLQELCSRQGAGSYSVYIREAGVGILDTLLAFPSASPPLTLLLEHLPRLQPRPYSAASSQLRQAGSLDIVFNVVDIPGGCGRAGQRYGLCTGYLDNLTTSIQHKPSSLATDELSEDVKRLSLSPPAPSVGIYLRSNQHFRPCEDLSRPVIMIGPGTGVAPFIGFLQHRELQLQSKVEGEVGESWLFFGCRHRERDFIFRHDMENYVTSGVLTHLHVCHSRDDVTGEAVPRYVQDLIASQSQAIAETICDKNAMIYVCGDAKGMARDVSNALSDVIKEYKGLSDMEVEAYMKALRLNRCLLEDVWT